MSQPAMRAQELSDPGAKGRPRLTNKFAARVTNPEKAPIAWDDARDFYSNVSRLSASEYQNMNPQMARAVGQFAGAFDDSLRAAAEAAGKGDEYAQTMQLYRTAKGWQRFEPDVWQAIVLIVCSFFRERGFCRPYPFVWKKRLEESAAAQSWKCKCRSERRPVTRVLRSG